MVTLSGSLGGKPLPVAAVFSPAPLRCIEKMQLATAHGWHNGYRYQGNTMRRSNLGGGRRRQQLRRRRRRALLLVRHRGVSQRRPAQLNRRRVFHSGGRRQCARLRLRAKWHRLGVWGVRAAVQAGGGPRFHQSEGCGRWRGAGAGWEKPRATADGSREGQSRPETYSIKDTLPQSNSLKLMRCVA